MPRVTAYPQYANADAQHRRHPRREREELAAHARSPFAAGTGRAGPGRLPARGSHRSVRARIRAYGSSDHAFARAMHRRVHAGPSGPAPLSSGVSLTRCPDCDASDVFPSGGLMIRRPASLHAVPRCVGVPALREPSVLSGRCDFPPPVPPRFVSFARRCRRCVPPVRSRRPRERPAGGPGLVEVRPARAEVCSDGNDGISQVPGEPPLHLRRALRPRQDHRRLTGLQRRHGAAPAAATSRAPALPLSRLNPPALVLAVYASPRRSPAKDARLASGCWSGSAGRASTRRVPTRGFRVFLYISSSSPKLAWRNAALGAAVGRGAEVVAAGGAEAGRAGRRAGRAIQRRDHHSGRIAVSPAKVHAGARAS